RQWLPIRPGPSRGTTASVAAHDMAAAWPGALHSCAMRFANCFGLGRGHERGVDGPEVFKKGMAAREFAARGLATLARGAVLVRAQRLFRRGSAAEQDPSEARCGERQGENRGRKSAAQGGVTEQLG